MGIFSCLLGNRPSKWLTDRVKLLIFMRVFLLILAFVQNQKKEFWCNFYEDMVSFVNLANEYLSKYDGLTKSKKEDYQNRLHEILKRMCHYHTYVIGGTWGDSWTLPQLYAFYQAVLSKVKQGLYPGEIGEFYYLPEFSYSQSSDRLIRQKIKRELFGVIFNLPREMCQAFPVIFKSDSRSQPLNVPPPVVLNQSVDSSANWTNLAGMSIALAVATPRGNQNYLSMCAVVPKDPTPVPTLEMKSIEKFTPPRTPRTPRTSCTPRSPGFSKWLLFELLSREFLEFLKQQSEQSQSKQLSQMFKDLKMYLKIYGVELVYYQNSTTIRSFFQALNEYPVVKTALELYYEEPLAGWMDIQIVTDSNEEDQKRFYEYLKMMIHLKVWLCNDDADKPKFSAECAGKRWVLDELNNSFDISDLPEPSTIGEQAPMA